MYRVWNSTFKHLHNASLLSKPPFSRSVCCLMFRPLDSCLIVKSSSQKKSPIINTSLLINYEYVISYERKAFFLGGKNYLTTSSHGRQDKDVQGLVKEILGATREVDVMVDSLHISDVEDLVTQLQNQGFNKKSIQRLLSRRLWLLKQPDQMATLTQLLLSQMFPPSAVCRLIEAIPYDLQNLLHQLPDRISRTIQFFGKYGISEEDLWSVLSLNPKLLYLDLKTVETSVSQLKSIFSAKDIKKLLRKSPSLLLDPWPEVYHKYQYAVFSMVYSNNDIVNSRLFSHSFDHIKNRHLFLVRAGLFSAVSHKLDPALNPNPRLNDVVDTSNLTFLKHFPIASLDEYYSYCEMRAIEEEMEDDMINEYSDEDLDMDSDDSDSEREIVKKHASRTFALKKHKKKS